MYAVDYIGCSGALDIIGLRLVLVLYMNEVH